MSNISDVKIGNEYSFKSHFVGDIKLKLIGVVGRLSYMSSQTYVWYHEKLGYFYGLGNEIEVLEELTSFQKDFLEKLVKVIEENEIN